MSSAGASATVSSVSTDSTTTCSGVGVRSPYFLASFVVIVSLAFVASFDYFSLSATLPSFPVTSLVVFVLCVSFVLIVPFVLFVFWGSLGSYSFFVRKLNL